jgi:hypothetical protein
VNMQLDRSDVFDRWVAGLEARHLADLTFPEVSRALRALSSAYVERRQRLAEGAALSGAGKRAAFALFYGPLHFLTVREIVASLDRATTIGDTLVDLGCGTGASGTAWAVACAKPPAVVAIDRNRWAIEEAASTFRHFGLKARTQMGDAATALPKRATAWLAAYTLNEMEERARHQLLDRLFDRAAEGARVLIVEPVARSAAPWWGAVEARARAAGARADEWCFRVELPDIVRKLDRAAGLNHRELKARSLFF